MEVVARQRVVNARGLHARPCHSIVSTALRFACTLRVACDGQEVDGKSILELMTLCAAKGAELEFKACGEGASELVALLCGLVGTGFGEES
jgi:phosphocarrier protein